MGKIQTITFMFVLVSLFSLASALDVLDPSDINGVDLNRDINACMCTNNNITNNYYGGGLSGSGTDNLFLTYWINNTYLGYVNGLSYSDVDSFIQLEEHTTFYSRNLNASESFGVALFDGRVKFYSPWNLDYEGEIRADGTTTDIIFRDLGALSNWIFESDIRTTGIASSGQNVFSGLTNITDVNVFGEYNILTNVNQIGNYVLNGDLDADNVVSTNIYATNICYSNGSNCNISTSSGGMNYTNIVMTNKTTQQNIYDINVSAIDVGSGSVQIRDGGFLEIYSTFPSFFLNESDCPFGNCKNAYFMLDGNRFQLQSYSAGRVYEYGVMDLNMRAPNQLVSDYLGRIGLGGMSSGEIVGTVNINSSRTYSPQLNFKNSTLATTRYAGSLERSANKLIYTQNDLNHTQVMMLRNVTRYSCDLGNAGEFGYNYSDNRAYYCNSTNWRILA